MGQSFGMRSLGCLMALLLALTVVPAALAQTYPARTVTVIVPFPPG